MVVDTRSGTYNVAFLGCRLQIFGRYRHSIRLGHTFNVKVGRLVFKFEVYNEATADRLYDERPA